MTVLHCPLCGRVIRDEFYCDDCGELSKSDYERIKKPKAPAPKKEVVEEEPIKETLTPVVEDTKVEEKASPSKKRTSLFGGQPSMFDSVFTGLNEESTLAPKVHKENPSHFGYLIGGKKYSPDNTLGALHAIYNSRNINYVFAKNSSKQLSNDFLRILENHLGMDYHAFMENFNNIIKSIDDREIIFTILISKLLGELNIKSPTGETIRFENKNDVYKFIIKNNFKKTLDKNLINIYIFLCDDACGIPSSNRDMYFEISKQIFDFTGRIPGDGEVIYLDGKQEIKFGKFSHFLKELAISKNALEKNNWLKNIFTERDMDFVLGDNKLSTELISLFKVDIEHADSFFQNIRFLSIYSQIIYFEDPTNSANKDAYISNSEQRLLSLARDYQDSRFSKNSHQAKSLMTLYFLFRMGVFDKENSLFHSLGTYMASSDYSVIELSKKLSFDEFVKQLASNIKPNTVRFLGRNVTVEELFNLIKEMGPIEVISAVISFMDDERGLATLAKIYNVKFSSRNELANRLAKILK